MISNLLQLNMIVFALATSNSVSARSQMLVTAILSNVLGPNELNDCQCRIIGLVHCLENKSRVYSRKQLLPLIQTPLVRSKRCGHV